MPIIHIRTLPPKKYVEVDRVLSNLCIRVADGLGLPENQLWATWHELKSDHYVEGGKSVSEQPTSTHPPLVEIVALEGKSQAEIEKMMKLVASNLAELLKIDSENIFISYRETLKGKTMSGGLVL